MSRIWAALPELNPLDPDTPNPPAGACWWRHPLIRNAEGNELIIRTDSTSDRQAPRLGCWEFFDGSDEQLIAGVDVFRILVCQNTYGTSHIDVLALDVPTRSPRWLNLTEPGDWNLRHCRFDISAEVFRHS
ncbi:hypothetical protein MKUB_32920 [Mycobacterium kubicae]|nr:hypothetical protein [Mycobacterium kubicae]MCV7095284.1 hypothetical protein [Mycobacterium kubicae]QNI14356.1 hypothetical protein GAN18_27700 [Mycobacterium kubicae]GFG65802.1 hypothetical protein MKUB_32920 [Mycobacterium kubicae]